MDSKIKKKDNTYLQTITPSQKKTNTNQKITMDRYVFIKGNTHAHPFLPSSF